eukprot:SAG22_NODE_2438_length_2574_cov_2.578586_3_plen_302_part_00
MLVGQVVGLQAALHAFSNKTEARLDHWAGGRAGKSGGARRGCRRSGRAGHGGVRRGHSMLAVLGLLAVAAQAPDGPAGTAAAATTGGAELQVSQTFLDFMLDNLIPELDAIVAAANIPSTSGKSHGFEYDVKDLKVAKLDLTKASIAYKETQGIMITVPFDVELTGHWSYKLHDWPHKPSGSGTFDAKANGGSQLATLLAVGTDGTGRPNVTASGTTCKVDLHITVHGSMFSWLYDLIIKAFKGKIEGAICTAATSGINSLVNSKLKSVLAGANLLLPIPLPCKWSWLLRVQPVAFVACIV